MARSKQQKFEGLDALFAGMTPIEPEDQATAAEPIQKPRKAPERAKQTKVRKSTTKTAEADTEAQKKPDKRLFTVYIDATAQAKLKKYAAMTKQPIGSVTTAAILEYLERNPPTAEQREAYETRKKEEDIDI